MKSSPSEMIKVLSYRIDFSKDIEFLPSALKSLPEIVSGSIERLVRAEDQLRSVVGKLLLAHALALVGRPVSALSEIRRSEYLKPIFDFEFFFNISHSGEYVVLAYSEISEVGIDIEGNEIVDLEDFSDQFTELELQSILSYDPPSKEFSRIWTYKESVAKALGKGLYIPLKKINTLEHTLKTGEEFPNVEEIEIDEGYTCHLAYFGSRDSIEKSSVTMDQLLTVMEELLYNLETTPYAKDEEAHPRRIPERS